MFTQQFNDVRAANNCNDQAALLQLRSALEGSAVEVGRGATVDEIFVGLGARFGLTVTQAHHKLINLRREPGQSIHALGTQIQGLIRLAYPTMAQAEHTVLAIEKIKRTLDNKSLSRHLLAIPCNTIAETVTAIEEYFQAGGHILNNRPRFNVLDVEEDDPPTVAQVTESTFDKVLAALERMPATVAALVNQPTPAPVPQDTPRVNPKAVTPNPQDRIQPEVVRARVPIGLTGAI
mgnify:CR=1 FL=1